MKFNPPDIWINTKKVLTCGDILDHVEDEIDLMVISNYTPANWDLESTVTKVKFIKGNVRRIFLNEYADKLSRNFFHNCYVLAIDKMMERWLLAVEYEEWSDAQ